jgi:hypothetical protein
MAGDHAGRLRRGDDAAEHFCEAVAGAPQAGSQDYSGCAARRGLRTASTIHKQLAAKPPIAKAISNDTDISPSSIVTPLVEHDLFPKTGSHPASSVGQAFSGSCSNYFNAVLTDVKSDLTADPRLFTAAMIRSAIPDARIAYSIEVAPDGSVKKPMSFRMSITPRFI